MVTIILISLTIILISFIIYTFYSLKIKKIEYYNIRVQEAQQKIIEELNRRYELVMKTEEGIKKITKKDLDIYSELEKTKRSMISSYDLDEEITLAIKTIYTLKNDYIKVKENKELKEIIQELKQSDTKIIAAKSFYNKNAMELNDLIKKFPFNIMAKFLKIKIALNYNAMEIFDEIIDADI